MASNHPNNYWVALLRRALLGGLLLLTALQAVSQAQVTSITSDGTLGTTVTQVDSVFNIEGGTRPANGPNLFHSFGSFSVGTGDTARFNNTTPQFATTNILSRVTGGNPSNIFGTIDSLSYPGANLFLLNPAGVLFGPTASLNVSGAFHVSTADFLRFEDGAKFFADLSQDSTLTVAPPAAFGFLGGSPAAIAVEGSVLTVAPGATLALVGGETSFVGPDGLPVQAGVTVTGGQLTAPGGEVALVSVASGGEVATGAMYAGELTGFEALGPVEITGGSQVDVSAAGGGRVVIRGGQLLVDNATVFADTLGDVDGAPVGIDVEVTDAAVVSNNTFMTTDLLGAGNAGNIEMTAGHMEMTNSLIASRGFGGSAGQTGTLAFTAETWQVGGAFIGTSSSGTGVAGDVVADVGSVTLAGSAVDTSTIGSGNAGNILLLVQNEAVIENATLDLSAGTSAFQAGSLEILTGGTLQFNDTNIDTSSLGFGPAGSVLLGAGLDASFVLTNIDASATNGFAGPSGDVTIQAGQDLTFSFGSITTLTDSFFGARAGDVVLTAGGDALLDVSDIGTQSFTLFGRGGDVSVSAESFTMDLSGIDTTSGSTRSGNVSIDVGTYQQLNASEINTGMLGGGTAGAITIKATERAEVSGSATGVQSVLDASLLDVPGLPAPTGNGGAINITTPDLILDNAGVATLTGGTGQGGAITLQGARVAAQNDTLLSSGTFADGPGGSISIDSTESITFSGASGIANGATGTGDAGPVSLRSPTITLAGESLIGGNTSSAGSGASITIETERLTLTDGSGITSISSGAGITETEGTGGSITINASESVTLSSGTTGIESGIFASTIGDGNAGSISITSPTVLLEGGNLGAFSSDVLLPGNKGNAGAITLETGQLSLRNDGRISAGTAGATTAGAGGPVTIHAAVAVDIDGTSGDASIINGVEGSGAGGRVTIQTPVLTVSGGDGLIETQTLGAGPGGDIVIEGANLNLQDGGAISSSSAGSGVGGKVLVNATDAVSIGGTDTSGRPSALLSASSSIGDSGLVSVTTGTLSLSGGLISAKAFESANAGSVILQAGEFTSAGGQVTTEANTGAGGVIDIEAIAGISLTASEVSAAVIGGADPTRPTADVRLAAGQDLTLAQGTTVSARSDGAVDAGNVTLTAGGTIRLDNNSTVTTKAENAQGGDIKLKAEFLIDLIDSTIESSVLGGPGTVGGNISLDPRFVIIQNSNILTTAKQGDGGTITIIGDVVLVDPLSNIDVSSESGSSGRIDIQSPVTNLSGTLAPLPEAVLQATALLREACAARVRGGQASSLVLGGRDGVPLEPGGLLPSPLYLYREGQAGAPSAGHGESAEQPAFSVGLPGADPIVMSPVRGWSEPAFAQATLDLMCPK